MIVKRTPKGGISEIYIASPTGDAMSFEVPFLNSAGGPVEILISPVSSSRAGLQTNEEQDPPIPTCEEIAESLGFNTTRPVVLRVQKNTSDEDDDSGDPYTPSLAHVQRAVFGR